VPWSDVRLLVIGGQARHHYFGTPTRDLDIWAENGPALQDALGRWLDDHPMSSPDMQRPPRPEVRVWYPDGTMLRMQRNGPGACRDRCVDADR
jgi:hypothetical protein